MSASIFGLPPRSTWTIRCAMRSTVVACGVTATLAGSLQHLAAELGDVLRHGGREHQRLPLRRKLGDDLPDVVDEAHVEHAVGFVEHEHLDAGEPQRVALDQVEQAARRGDQHVDAVAAASAPGRPSGRRRWRARTGCAGAGRRRGSCRGSGRTVRGSGSAPARGRSCGCGRTRLAARWLRIGSAKAAVLPVPVCAMPMTSRLASSSGMVWAWIGVGVTYFSSVRARRIGSARPKSLKEFNSKVFLCASRAASQECERTPNAGFETSRVDRAVS